MLDLVVAGNSAERYAALVNGSVSAALLTDPGSFLLVDQGFSNLGALEDALPRMEFEGWTVNADTARQAPDALVAFLRGMVKTYQWLYDPANKEELLRIYREEYKLEPKIAEQAYAANVPGKMWNEQRADRPRGDAGVDRRYAPEQRLRGPTRADGRAGRRRESPAPGLDAARHPALSTPPLPLW